MPDLTRPLLRTNRTSSTLPQHSVLMRLCLQMNKFFLKLVSQFYFMCMRIFPSLMSAHLVCTQLQLRPGCQTPWICDELHAGVEILTLVLCKIKCSKLLCPLSNPNIFLTGPPTLINCRTKVHVSYSTQSSRDVRSRLKL